MNMRRWSGAAGIIFVVLAIVSSIVRGSVPDTSKSNAVEKFVNFYADGSHDTHAIASALLGFIGLFFFVWFLGGLWSAIRTADGGVSAPTIIVALGGAVFVAMGLAYHAVENVQGITLHFDKAYRAQHLFSPGTAILLNDLAVGMLMAAMIGIGAAGAAAGVVIWRSNVFPRWLAWIGFLFALLALPVIPPLSLIAAAIFGLWTIVISVLFITKPTPTPESAARSATG